MTPRCARAVTVTPHLTMVNLDWAGDCYWVKNLRLVTGEFIPEELEVVSHSEEWLCGVKPKSLGKGTKWFNVRHIVSMEILEEE